MTTQRTGEIERIDLGIAVGRRLRQLILDGELAPGARLVETSLAERFGTSRGPIRDGIGELQTAGLVCVVPRQGTYVARFEPNDVDEIYSLRTALESLAVERAVALGDDDDWRALDAALDQIDDASASSDPGGVANGDMHFHRALIRAARHARLAAAWESFADQTLLLLRSLSVSESDVQSTDGVHRDIVRELRERNAVAATALLQAHLESARRAILRGFELRAAGRAVGAAEQAE